MKSVFPRAALAWVAPLLSLQAQIISPEAKIQVPPGFSVTRVAASPLTRFPMMAAFDERGRLFVAENAGVNIDAAELLIKRPSRITLLEDSDGDGTFDRSRVFADGLTFPQGVLWHRNALYVASPPSIWRFTDTDDDGRADRREELVTGFEFTGNAADVHGPFLHPNGRLYWTHGRKGHDVRAPDGRSISKGLGARIWSMRPDGSDVQVHAGGGLDNPTELAFDQAGNVFGTANLFHGAPRSDAVVHWVYGGVYPRLDQERVLNEFVSTGGVLPAVSLLGHVAPAGAALLQSDFLGLGNPDTFIFAEFNTRRILTLPLRAHGSTFVGEARVFATSETDGVHFTDVIEDADGSLLIVDTGAWFRIGCPTSRLARPEILGGIYRVRRMEMPHPVDPRGAALEWANATETALAQRLSDARATVRERAIAALVDRGDAAVPALVTANKDPRVSTRTNALWALTRIGTPAARAAARPALRDDDPTVRQVAAHSTGVTGDSESGPTLIQLLRDASPAVRREAATSLGRLREKRATPPLFDAIAIAGEDPFLLHALIYALIEIGDVDLLREALTRSTPAEKRAGLIALGQISGSAPSPTETFAALRSPNAPLRTAALAALRNEEDWGTEAARFLQWAQEDPADPWKEEATALVLRKLLARAEVRDWLRAYLQNKHRSDDGKVSAFVPAVTANPALWDDAWRKPLQQAVERAALPTALAALEVLAAHKTDEFDRWVRALGQDPDRSPSLRLAALRYDVRQGEPISTQTFSAVSTLLEKTPAADIRIRIATTLGIADLSREQALALTRLLASSGPLELASWIKTLRKAPAQAELGEQIVEQLERTPARWSLKPEALTATLRRFSDPISERGRALIESIERQSLEKQERVANLENDVVRGDPRKGKELFLSGKGTCIACHRIADNGGMIGPDLSRIGQIRNRRDLLESILFPDASIARGYETFQVETKDGKVFQGTLPREDANALPLVLPDGTSISLRHGDILRVDPIATSLMPAGLDRLLEREELANLVSYLLSLR
ncbi:MAG TPA: HEAT repeat domain-containing protein [Opitutaceae bacterium]|nr:HEAT repeat domain-containing protein [Opitutaceae bacterium]